MNPSNISSLVNSQGIQLTSLPVLFWEATQYFSTLFSEDSPPTDNEDNIISSCIPSIITQEMNDYLMRLISLEELDKVVFGMPKGKAPSPDGYPVELF